MSSRSFFVFSPPVVTQISCDIVIPCHMVSKFLHMYICYIYIILFMFIYIYILYTYTHVRSNHICIVVDLLSKIGGS